MAGSPHPPARTPVAAQRTNLASQTLIHAEMTLNTLKTQIFNALQSHLLIEDDGDHDFKEVNDALSNLEDAISVYKTWDENGRETRDLSEHALPAPTGKRKNIATEAKRLFRRFFNPKKSGSNGTQTESPLERATNELKDADAEGALAITKLLNCTSQRSCMNPMGSFYLLAKSRRLGSLQHKSSSPIAGRYEDTGRAMFALFTQFMSIENALKDPGVIDLNETTSMVISRLYSKLGRACDTMIASVLAMPFDLEAFEYAMDRLKIIGEIIQNFVDKKDTGANLFDGVNVPDDPSSGDNSYRHEKLIQDMESIETYLKDRESAFAMRKKEFDAKVSLTPAHLRAIEHLGLKAGDLSNSATVVQCMRRPRKEGGLGIPLICEGIDSFPLRQKKGGYGMVSCMRLPKDASDVDEIKTSGRLVAVKVSLSSDSSNSLAISNIRMLREATLYAAVASDPRGLSDGGLFLAKVEGIWDNFQEQRPGLVSLWGDSDLEVYVRDNPLTMIQRLELAYKVARGVQYLHTCNPAIVHGDLKASNVIMINGEPRLTDFGVGKCLDGVRGLTTGYGSYTDDYRAPEIQHRDLSLVLYPTKESDVYAFACLLFEILSGKAPFNGFDETTRKSWTGLDMDRTPIDAELSLPNPHQFERPHLDLMKWCFNFHASRRPTMGLVVESIRKLLQMEECGSA